MVLQKTEHDILILLAVQKLFDHMRNIMSRQRKHISDVDPSAVRSKLLHLVRCDLAVL